MGGLPPEALREGWLPRDALSDREVTTRSYNRTETEHKEASKSSFFCYGLKNDASSYIIYSIAKPAFPKRREQCN